MKKKNRKVYLTDRDLNLFKYLFVGKISTVEQLQKHIFGGARRPTVYRRLIKLYKNQFIKKGGFIYNERPSSYYYLGAKGLDLINLKHPFGVNKVNKSGSYHHDITLNEIRKAILCQSKVNSVFSENQLQSYKNLLDDEELRPFIDLNSDGAIELKSDKVSMFFALEYDASIKSSRRYRQKIFDYYEQKSIPGVFYIGSKEVLNRLKVVENEICKKQDLNFKFFYSTLENVLDESKKIIFENQVQQKIIL